MQKISLEKVVPGDVIVCHVSPFTIPVAKTESRFWIRSETSMIQRLYGRLSAKKVMLTITHPLHEKDYWFGSLELGIIACWVEMPKKIELIASQKIKLLSA